MENGMWRVSTNWVLGVLFFTVRLPCRGCNFPRIFCIWITNGANDFCKQFFGLIVSSTLQVLDEAFPKHTFLMNGLIQGVKGFLSFLSAPLIGALSDIFGRKPFLFLTVTFTCSPIPFIKLSHWWYFTMISISGIFSVTFSVVLAFVSDVTTVENRMWAYGLVSHHFFGPFLFFLFVMKITLFPNNNVLCNL